MSKIIIAIIIVFNLNCAFSETSLTKYMRYALRKVQEVSKGNGFGIRNDYECLSTKTSTVKLKEVRPNIFTDSLNKLISRMKLTGDDEQIESKKLILENLEDSINRLVLLGKVSKFRLISFMRTLRRMSDKDLEETLVSLGQLSNEMIIPKKYYQMKLDLGGGLKVSKEFEDSLLANFIKGCK